MRMHCPILVITLACLSSAKPAAFDFGSGGISFGGSSFGNLGGSSFGNLGGSSLGGGSFGQAVQREAQDHFNRVGNNLDWNQLSRGSINVDSINQINQQHQHARDILNRQRANLDWNRPIQVDSTGFHQYAQNNLNRVMNNLDWNRPITVDSTGINDWDRTHSGSSQGNQGSVSGNAGTSYSDYRNSGTSYSDSGNSGTSYSDSGNSGTSYSDSGNSGISYTYSGNDGSQSEFEMSTGEHGSGEYGIGWCPDFTPGDNVGGGERFLQEHQMIEPTCEQSCKVHYPSSIGITESTVETYNDGRSKCWCEFGEPDLNVEDAVVRNYRTCLFG